MTRTPARFRQCDIARALRAVKQCDVDMRVRLTPDNHIIIEKDDHATPETPVAASVEFRL